jgi:glycosyltransferase involved in cell wall biosynthesis
MGIDLRLIYGRPNASDAKKRDFIALSWAEPITNKVWRIRDVELFWQPCRHMLRDVDLVIVEQANKLLLNALLIATRHAGARRIAFWGHGKDFQGSARRVRVRDRLKRLVATRVDWWFAYNETVKKVVEQLGFPAARVTNVQNAIDTRELLEHRASVTPPEIEALRARLGIKGRDVCIYIGALYAEKRIQFLLDACKILRRHSSEFEMIFVGAGPDEGLVDAAARENPWLHRVGPAFDRDKVPYLLASKLVLMPGAVGLVVLDSFVLGVPMVTTDVPYHGPEIEYLEHGVNGWIVADSEDPEPYARAVLDVLTRPGLHEKLVQGCERAKLRYTNEEMVERFAQGIVRALALHASPLS